MLSYNALENVVEWRLAELREEAARARAVAPPEPAARPAPAPPLLWYQVQNFGREGPTTSTASSRGSAP